ncbi:type II toxin-antitoxin system HicB family antitoxin [Anaerovibrio sp. RM50]|uniref:type II toxin-antitoxin system HicB family antitoxin n=1 Tax=Anaerovibrio sp. RM50 TaxID=1200557 RepID=UPI000A02DE75|nr:type II toxin-antitoxin system HicB family antitoxin [Anaerovibrio sp. RM50]
MSNNYYYPAIFQPEDIGFSVSVPDLPGCFTQGDTLDEALEMAQEAIGIMLEDIPEKDYPTASNPAKLVTEGDQFVMMVHFDKLAYDKKYNSKAVKKTLSIPAWLNK